MCAGASQTFDGIVSGGCATSSGCKNYSASSKTKVKICGLSRPVDIEYVNTYKPDFCGFIINFPKSHRSISPDTVRSLVSNLSNEIKPVGVFVDEPIETIASLLNDGSIA